MARPVTGARLLALWEKLGGWPGGPRLFSILLGRMVPYTGTVGARVDTLKPGFCRVTLRDRRRVRNHLRSVHAIALANLAEMTGGLALMTAGPAGMRGILASFTIDYLKKARGTLRAESAAPIPAAGVERDYGVHITIEDESGAVVARAVARWRIAPA